MDLKQATSKLMRAPDVGYWIKLADTHMAAYNKMPSAFVLPAKHAVLQPIIEAFASDTEAFAEYIRALRDGSDGAAKDELHDLYRTISVRALQNVRRNRIRRAVMAVLPRLQELANREFNYNEQLVIGRYIEQKWGAMRMDAMEVARKERRLDRLSSEARAVLLDNFWRDIERTIDSEHGPLTTDELLEALRLLEKK